MFREIPEYYRLSKFAATLYKLNCHFYIKEHTRTATILIKSTEHRAYDILTLATAAHVHVCGLVN